MPDPLAEEKDSPVPAKPIGIQTGFWFHVSNAVPCIADTARASEK
jgi:hypothetical protein